MAPVPADVQELVTIKDGERALAFRDPSDSPDLGLLPKLHRRPHGERNGQLPTSRNPNAPISVTFLLGVLDVLGFKKRVIRPSCGQTHQMLLTALPSCGDALTLPANEETEHEPGQVEGLRPRRSERSDFCVWEWGGGRMSVDCPVWGCQSLAGG